MHSSFFRLTILALNLFLLPCERALLGVNDCVGAQTNAQAVVQQPDADTVVFSVLVTNRAGVLIGRVPKEDFIVYSDDERQKISFFSEAAAPASIVFLVDLSGSMSSRYRSQTNKAKLLIEALTAQLEKSQFADEYSVLSFNEDVRLDLAWTKSKTETLAKLRMLTMAEGKGKTAFYQAAAKGIVQAQSGANPIKVVVMLSDGQDNLGAYSDGKALLELLRRSSVVAYQINPTCIPMNLWDKDRDTCIFQAADFSQQLSKISGGMVFTPGSKEKLDPIMAYLFNHIRQRYFIGFKPQHAAGDDKFHRLKVKVIAPAQVPKELRNPLVHHREGYYSSATIR